MTAASTWLAGARLVDLDTGAARTGVSVELAGDTIARVEDGRPPRGAEVIDLHGGYLLPGLVTVHVHLQGLYPYSLRDERESPGLTTLRAARRAREALEVGITTVRCLHEQHRADLLVREAAARGWARAPRILGAGRALTVTGGHGHGLGCAVADGHDGFLRAARAELAAGADHVKVFLTGGLARAGEGLDAPQLTREEMAGAVRAAGERGTYVAAHAGGPVAIRQGIEAGIRCFEHAYRLDAGTAALLASAGAYLTPTLAVTNSPGWMRDRGFDDAAVARAAAAREEHLESARLAVRAGVALLNGTDFPPADRDGGVPLVVREAELLVAAGLDPFESLRAATATPARLLGLDDRIGRVAPGHAADLLAVDADPTQSVSALRQPSLVVHAGHPVVPPTR